MSRTILLVEDDPAWAALTREAFLDVAPDVRLEVLSEGGVAIERLQEPDAPSVVLLDLNMPGVDGREVLRSLPSADRTKVVVLSASVSARDRALAAEMGAAAYANKPTTFAALHELAAAVVSGDLARVGVLEPVIADHASGDVAPSITHLRVVLVAGHDPSLARRLTAAGFDVRPTTTVDELPSLLASPVECVVVDLDAPGCRRHEAIRAARDAAGHTPVVVVMGAVTEAAELAALAAGATDVVAAEDATQEVLRRTVRFAVERNALTTALERQHRFVDAVVDNVNAAIVACDATGRLQVVNAAAHRLHGRDADPAIAPADWGDAYGLVDLDTRTPLRPDEIPLVRALAGERIESTEVGVASPDGAVRRCLVRGQPLHDRDGELLGAVVVFDDVTDQRRMEAALAHQALHDPLTGLPNRTLALDRLRHAAERALREGLSTALLYVDLDRFKRVNDTFGHAAGDAVLRTCADRLLAAVRPGDTVARLGGDEFVVISEAIPDEPAALALADRIHDALQQPVAVGACTVLPSASIGIVVTPAVGSSPEAVLQEADAAMYAAKRTGRGRSAVAA